MSRLLMAAPSRLSREMRTNRLNSLVNVTRQMATKTPSKSTAAKCPAPEPPKLKPGYFPSGGTHAVFSDMPKPEGDFMKAWHAKNSKYNMVLLSGILAVIGSIVLTVTSGKMPLFADVPDYPYTEDEMEEFAVEEQRRQEEKEAREQLHQDMVEAKELKMRRRKAKEAMAREVELMQKDLDEGVTDNEMAELVKLTQEREEFESWEKEEMKRLEEKEKERDKIKKEKEKARQEQLKQIEKERKERQKAN
ncbi:histone-lysine N-methyltransferase, H3 lysine-79 specific [Drosophila novamexicana]|uniref:histone-lysine N-methyltransferase, H3 lysine-79 specific n=1 Tax=Drosophila novamexicana TaxID=47314 RepID=UPI0011E6001E|nr:histone-lysine N-methyltransferase, H3 lysine-79 specific [Drosophila novamexicana]